MKKQLLLVVLGFVSSALFIGCNEDDGPTTINPDRIARFLDGNETIAISEESTEILEIPVYVNYDHEAPVVVNFEIEGDPANYEMISEYGQAVIPAGERQGVILLKAVGNDDVNDPVNTALIRITGADSDFAAPSGISIGHAEKIITFIDDDCELPLASSYSAAVTAFSQSAPAYTATVTSIGNDQYTIDSAWGPDFVAWATGNGSYSGQFIYSGELHIDACNRTVEVVGDDGWATGGSGTVSEDGTITYTLTQGLFTTDFTVDVSLSPN